MNLPIRLGFLASHGGSNMQAIINNCKNNSINASPALLISNNSKSGAIEKAIKENIPYFHLSLQQFPNAEDLDNAITETMLSHSVDLVILAGYMKKIGSKLLSTYHNRILNIHPALLPNYGGEGMWGMNVHKAVIAAGEKKSGATVHLVSEEYDEGRILGQKEVLVEADDTAESLAERVLKAEHILYSEVINKIANKEIML